MARYAQPNRIIDTIRVMNIGIKYTTSQIRDELAALGYDVTSRTVQRDLVELQSNEALSIEYDYDASCNTNLWRRTKAL